MNWTSCRASPWVALLRSVAPCPPQLSLLIYWRPPYLIFDTAECFDNNFDAKEVARGTCLTVACEVHDKKSHAILQCL